LTKSALVTRDVDLLQQFQRCSVGVSLMTTNDDVARHFEPCASSPSQRIHALQMLKDAGIRTYAFISPYIPGISSLDLIIAALHGIVDEIGVEAINAKGGNWRGVEQVLMARYPQVIDESKQRVRDEVYWEVIEQQARQLTEGSGADFMGFFRH
jgi:DNA repair photolyase